METLSKRKLTYVALALVAFGVIMRLVPHAANFAPVGAIALFGGAVLPKKVAWWLPVAVMAVSDLFIGFYSGILFTWAAYLMVALFGMTLRRTRNLYRIVLGSLGGATIFFLVSNFGTWAQGGLYPHTWAGFVQCYTMAIPFFRNTLAGDLFYNALLFGAFAFATSKLAAPKPKLSEAN
jgi:hypothetical protein